MNPGEIREGDIFKRNESILIITSLHPTSEYGYVPNSCQVFEFESGGHAVERTIKNEEIYTFPFYKNIYEI